MNVRKVALLGALAATAAPTAAMAQLLPLDSNVESVTLNATLVEALTITVQSGSVVNFEITPGAAENDGDVPVVVQTDWQLGAGRGQVELFGYFGNPLAALSDGGTGLIPSSAVLASVGGGAYAAFSETATVGAVPVPVGTALATRKLYTQAITAANQIGSRTDNINLRIDSSALLTDLSTGDYTGTLMLRAHAW